LPESYDILKTVDAHTSEMYSDSDVDSLIRAVPLDNNQEVAISKLTMYKDSKKPGEQPRVSPSTPLPTLKRTREASPTLERCDKFPKIVAALSPVDHPSHVMVYGWCPAWNASI
jgi:ATP-dependent DNA helicase HFM1/MER3